uniref:C-type lectin domain-containing protein n=1 Tax=Acrobeloides nanus TaxID=290746 RepID=A0A914ENF6_9BILA
MLLVLFSLVFFQLSLSCPSNMLSGLSDDPCYQLVTTPAPFLTAEYNCAQMGGHLASVGNAFLKACLNQNAQFLNYDSYWLGGSSNVFVSGNWVWTDGENFTYNNWAPGQPNKDNSSYGIAANLQSGKWYSVSTTVSKPFICEVPSTMTNHKCPIGWIYSSFTDRCYKFADSDIVGVPYFDYNIGKATCQNYSSSADLASIRDFNENTIISAYALNLIFSAQEMECSEILGMDCCILIGLYYNGNQFQWTDGTSFNFTNWQKGQPDTSDGQISAIVQVGGDDMEVLGSDWYYHNIWQTAFGCGNALCEMASIPDN